MSQENNNTPNGIDTDNNDRFVKCLNKKLNKNYTSYLARKRRKNGSHILHGSILKIVTNLGRRIKALQ